MTGLRRRLHLRRHGQFWEKIGLRLDYPPANAAIFGLGDSALLRLAVPGTRALGPHLDHRGR